jgi:hypothetical protein
VPDSAVETTQFLVRKVCELRRSAIARFFQPPIAPAITIYLVAQTMKDRHAKTLIIATSPISNRSSNDLSP